MGTVGSLIGRGLIVRGRLKCREGRRYGSVVGSWCFLTVGFSEGFESLIWCIAYLLPQ